MKGPTRYIVYVLLLLRSSSYTTFTVNLLLPTLKYAYSILNDDRARVMRVN